MNRLLCLSVFIIASCGAEMPTDSLSNRTKNSNREQINPEADAQGVIKKSEVMAKDTARNRSTYNPNPNEELNTQHPQDEESNLEQSDDSIDYLGDFMLTRDTLIYSNNFNPGTSVPTTDIEPLMDTRWSVTNEGYFRGIRRPIELPLPTMSNSYYGSFAYMNTPVTPASTIVTFKVRFTGGDTDRNAQFEIGHHVVTVEMMKTGIEITTLKHPDSITHCVAKDFKHERGVWYHVQMEKRGDEFLISVDNKFTFYFQHSSLSRSGQKDYNGLIIHAAKNGIADLDDLRIWTVKDGYQSSWDQTKQRIKNDSPCE